MQAVGRLFVLVVLVASTALAQERGAAPRRGGRGGQRGGPGVASPAIESDGKVTFRLRAPEAKTVTLNSDFLAETFEMTKGDDGVWSVTVGPLKPDMYYYSFNVDGVKLLDPANSQAKIGFTTSTITSILDIPGEDSDFYAIKDVPHGQVRLERYNSKSNGVIRELNVYTPPGYEEHPDLRYPVLYLLHGANNDLYSWSRYGKASEILDNRLAEGAIKPFIVVMPMGYGGASADGRVRGPRGGGGRGGAGGAAAAGGAGAGGGARGGRRWDGAL